MEREPLTFWPLPLGCVNLAARAGVWGLSWRERVKWPCLLPGS